jgi:predicted alpha/beta superfamily hydrolase
MVVTNQPPRSSKEPQHTLTGNIRQHTHFESRILRTRRDILVYLPRAYRRQGRTRYPVLYLHDGQNVFDAATSFAGVEWGVDETAQRLIRKKLIEPLIVVAVANTGVSRIDEYAPTRGVIQQTGTKKKRSRGLGKNYGRFLVEELKPFIDKTYRTRPEGEFTGLAGSSLGGLITLALGFWFPESFTRLGVMSPAVWWDDQAIVKMVESLEDRLPLKIWLDTGTHEEGWERTRNLRDALVEKGWRLYNELQYTEVEGAEHTEAAWAGRVDPMLRFLFPPPPSPRR